MTMYHSLVRKGMYDIRDSNIKVGKHAIEDIRKINKLLKKHGYNESNKFVHNDGENECYTIDSPLYKEDIFILTDQNATYITFVDKKKFITYHVFEEIPKDAPKILKAWGVKKTFEGISKVAELMERNYTDNVLDNNYVSRPNLSIFLERNIFACKEFSHGLYFDPILTYCDNKKELEEHDHDFFLNYGYKLELEGFTCNIEFAILRINEEHS